MPKHKMDDEYDYLLKKRQKLDRKIRRRQESRNRSPSRHRSESKDREQNLNREFDDRNRVVELLGGNDTNSAENIDPSITTPTIDLIAEQASADYLPVPSTSAGVIQNSPEDDESTNLVLDEAIRELLGDDPTISRSYGDEVHKDLAIRLEHIATHGVSKEIRKELAEKYLPPANCQLIDAPALNAEMKVAISDLTAKRDKNIEYRQKQNAIAISCLSQVINKLFSNKDSDPTIVKMLMDTERILCDLQYHDSLVRRNFILSSIKKELKDQLQNTKPDKLLFGKDFCETLKAAKAITKSGVDQKVTASKPQAIKKQSTPSNLAKNLNWKGPYPARKQSNYPRTKDPPPSQNRNQPPNSSRHLQRYQTRGRR